MRLCQPIIRHWMQPFQRSTVLSKYCRDANLYRSSNSWRELSTSNHGGPYNASHSTGRNSGGSSSHNNNRHVQVVSHEMFQNATVYDIPRYLFDAAKQRTSDQLRPYYGTWTSTILREKWKHSSNRNTGFLRLDIERALYGFRWLDLNDPRNNEALDLALAVVSTSQKRRNPQMLTEAKLSQLAMGLSKTRVLGALIPTSSASTAEARVLPLLAYFQTFVHHLHAANVPLSTRSIGNIL
jgi:hypothetical protein